ncbi:MULTISPECIES: hypothetical protein [Photorhabdus]|uniref:Uncharacterized protein n=2 Tax=Photorhabdus TaxID=29487 RepID=A0A4R4JH98_9GAMM|nr:MULTISPECIES: hypothetical protein [Photorhabdus]NHB98464.1 hypothetical protein [Photorhabdus stackebrandtii]TDB53587.1 hypothetical protein C5467_14765 [Photorhabdus khanii subsp. guanajuatensis]
MNDDVTLSYYNLFFVVIYYAMSIFIFIILVKLRGYVKVHIQEVLFTLVLLFFNTVQYTILANGGVLIYIFPHYFSIYDYDSITYGALFFLIAYSCLVPVSKFYRDKENKKD